MNLISRKKPSYPLSQAFTRYLYKYGREQLLPLDYEQLTRYDNSITLYDRKGADSLWVTVFYPQSDLKEIHEALIRIYSLIKTAGNVSAMEHLYVDRVDLCVYGNTLPFRVRVVNRMNDNFDYFYIKKADASRVLGLELEHLLSPNRIGYILHGTTLVEEHIAGIPADQFIKHHLTDRHFDEIRLAKEFVKFNERCFIRLLGDMHSSNFVIDVTPDFEETHYRMRAIDFDQQSFEGRRNIYLPQFFRQNLRFVELVQKNLTVESVMQYQLEERSMIANRIRAARYQVKALLDAVLQDELSIDAHVKNLASELAQHYQDTRFLEDDTMGKLLKRNLKKLVDKKTGDR